MLPPPAFPVSDATNRFCAGALEQTRMSVPQHTIQVNRRATPGAGLNFVSVSLFFMVMEPFTDVLREIWPAVTRKVWKTTADDADFTDWGA